jgi:hypothetical protein
MRLCSRSVHLVETELEKVQADKDKSAYSNKVYYCDVMKQKFSNHTTFANRLETKRYKKCLEESKELKIKVEASKNEITEKAPEKPKEKVRTSQDSPNICLFTNKEYESIEK